MPAVLPDAELLGAYVHADDDDDDKDDDDDEMREAHLAAARSSCSCSSSHSEIWITGGLTPLRLRFENLAASACFSEPHTPAPCSSVASCEATAMAFATGI